MDTEPGKRELSSLLDGYLSEDEFCAELKIVVRTARSWRQRGAGPPFVSIGRNIFYPKKDFREWLARRVTQPVRSRRVA